MKIIVPVVRKTEIGYRLTTTIVYGEAPKQVDTFLHRYDLAAHTAFDQDLQIATRAIHSGHIAWKATAMVVVCPVVFAIVFLLHVLSETGAAFWAAVREIVADIPTIHDGFVATLRSHFSKVSNP